MSQLRQQLIRSLASKGNHLHIVVSNDRPIEIEWINHMSEFGPPIRPNHKGDAA